MYEQLFVLEKQGYIAKRYDSSYRLRLRPAEYCLAPDGIRYLRDNTDLSWTALRNQYKNRSAPETFVDNCLEVMAVALKLEKLYPKTFNIFTRPQCSGFDWLPRPLPQLYLTRKRPKDETNGHYMVQIVEADLPKFVLSKILRTYQDHSEEWDATEHGDYPDILLLARNDRTEQRLLGQLENMMQDFELYTTTVERLLNADNERVWVDVMEQEEDEPLVLMKL